MKTRPAQAGGLETAQPFTIQQIAKWSHVPARRPVRTLDGAERQAVLETLHAERFVDQPLAQAHAILFDEGTYLCWPRTMYRLLESAL